MDDQSPWPLTPETGTCEQHSITQQGFLSILPWPAATSLWGGTLRPEEHRVGGEGERERVRESIRVKALISLVLKQTPISRFIMGCCLLCLTCDNVKYNLHNSIIRSWPNCMPMYAKCSIYIHSRRPCYLCNDQ